MILQAFSVSMIRAGWFERGQHWCFHCYNGKRALGLVLCHSLKADSTTTSRLVVAGQAWKSQPPDALVQTLPAFVVLLEPQAW